MAGTAVTEPPPPRRLRAARSVTLSPWTILTVLFFAAVAVYYVWTAATTAEAMHFNKTGSRYYGLLADALRHGQLSLRIQTPQALLDLPNPYDPIANQPFRTTGRLWDLSLRNGHLYAPWGPTAAIVLFAPFQLIGIQIPESLAVALFGFLGFLFSAMTLRFLVRRFLPDTPRWALAAATVFLAFGNSMPFALRRPSFYEVAIACALCFVMLGLWLLVTGWFGPRPSRRRLAGASFCLGLALLSRPTLGAVAIVPLGMALAAWRRGAWPKGVTRSQTLVALLMPFVACGLLLAAYNFARFGSPTEFGLKYQLGGIDPAILKSFQPAFIPSGLFLYLVEPPRPMALFPFVQLSAVPILPWSTPDEFIAPEATGGVLILAPLLLWILLLPIVARRIVPDLRGLIFGLVGAGAVIVFAMSFVLPGTTQRYTIDFMALLSLAAVLIWLVTLTQAERGSWRRRLAAGSGLLVLVWGSMVGLALGFTGYYDLFTSSHHPKLFLHLQDAFSPVSALETRIAGRPVIGMVSSPEGSGPGKMTWGSLGDGDGASFFVSPPPGTVVTVAVPRSGTYHLRGGISPGTGAVGTPEVTISHAGESDRTMKVNAPQAIDVPLKLKAGVSRISWSGVARRMRSPQLLIVQSLTITGPDS
jgi:Ca2+/Na+ antiporter